MSLMRIAFAAPINKVEMKEVGGKALAEISICRKNRVKEGDPEAFTWLRIALWQPLAFMIPKLVKGSFIAGSGEFTLRSYQKDGVKRQSAECNCQSFDVEVSDGQPREAMQQAIASPKPSYKASIAPDDAESPPF